jgi:hypothetical protein
VTSGPRPAHLSGDTSPAIEARQIARWRSMTADEKFALAAAATAAVRELAMAGLRVRHPAAGERELFLRYAVLTIGRDAAVRIYPDAQPFAGV